MKQIIKQRQGRGNRAASKASTTWAAIVLLALAITSSLTGSSSNTAPVPDEKNTLAQEAHTSPSPKCTEKNPVQCPEQLHADADAAIPSPAAALPEQHPTRCAEIASSLWASKCTIAKVALGLLAAKKLYDFFSILQHYNALTYEEQKLDFMFQHRWVFICVIPLKFVGNACKGLLTGSTTSTFLSTMAGHVHARLINNTPLSWYERIGVKLADLF